MEANENTAKQAVPLPWWIVTSRRRFGNGLTTTAPFWRPVHLRNLISRLHLWYLVKRGY